MRHTAVAVRIASDATARGSGRVPCRGVIRCRAIAVRRWLSCRLRAPSRSCSGADPSRRVRIPTRGRALSARTRPTRRRGSPAPASERRRRAGRGSVEAALGDATRCVATDRRSSTHRPPTNRESDEWLDLVGQTPRTRPRPRSPRNAHGDLAAGRCVECPGRGARPTQADVDRARARRRDPASTTP